MPACGAPAGRDRLQVFRAPRVVERRLHQQALVALDAPFERVVRREPLLHHVARARAARRLPHAELAARDGQQRNRHRRIVVVVHHAERAAVVTRVAHARGDELGERRVGFARRRAAAEQQRDQRNERP
jgi:hypothetical protein